MPALCGTHRPLCQKYQFDIGDSGELHRINLFAVPLSQTPLKSATLAERSKPTDSEYARATAAIRQAAATQLINIVAIKFDDGEALIYYHNSHYFKEADAIGRLTRILMADAPATVEQFRLIAVNDSVPQQEFDVLRSPMERAVENDPGQLAPETAIRQDAAPLQNPVLWQQTSYPNFAWSINPRFRQQLFDPVNPFAVQFLAAAGATVELWRGLSLNGDLETSLYDNFNTTRPASSALPHVRTDVLKYFVQGRTGISSLQTDYRFRLAPNVFANIKAGYLESMFAGFGGEVLWRPEGARWALGADLYKVWQRNFDRMFGLRDYDVVTGHVSLYYQSPWHGLNFALSAGQYLAGDRGVTLAITRRFSTGVEIGAFVTKTNVSAAQFGEGSFDKGIIIRIPLDWAMPISTQSQFNMDLRPVQRDGGQRLSGDATLYEETGG